MFHTLIVDDAKAELEVLLFLIQKNNLPLKTVTAINGEEALACLQKEPFDILITDIRMPYMDGLTLAGEALKLYPSIKVVISSGYQDFSYAKTAISLGVEEYLLKPVTPSDFVPLIAKLTAQIEKERQSSRNNQIKTIYSRDSIMRQLLSGSLRPGRNGLLPPEIRALMPDSCSLILLSVSDRESSSLHNLKPEILQLARQFFSRPMRGILLERELLLSADSTDHSFMELSEWTCGILCGAAFADVQHLSARCRRSRLFPGRNPRYGKSLGLKPGEPFKDCLRPSGLSLADFQAGNRYEFKQIYQNIPFKQGLPASGKQSAENYCHKSGRRLSELCLLYPFLHGNVRTKP